MLSNVIRETVRTLSLLASLMMAVPGQAARPGGEVRDWREPGRVQPMRLIPRQAQRSGGTQERTDTWPLPVGEVVERQTKGDEIHYFAVELRRGQVLQAEVQEHGVDLVLMLTKPPDGNPLALSNLGSGHERESFAFVVEQAGRYDVVIGCGETSVGGTYRLTAEIKDAQSAAAKGWVEARRLLDEGRAATRGGGETGLREAIEKWEASLLLWKKLGEKYWEGETRAALGRHYNNLGEKDQALHHFVEALALFRQIGERREEAAALANLGALYLSSGDYGKAVEHYDHALSLFRQVGDLTGQSNTLTGIGVVYIELGKPQKALEQYAQALQLQKQHGDLNERAMILLNIGNAYFSVDEYDEALKSYNEALPLFKQVASRRGEAAVLASIGNTNRSLNENRTALEYFDRALSLYKQIGSLDGIASTLYSAGLAYNDLGERKTALDHQEQALQLFRRLRDRRREAAALNSLAAIYFAAGENHKAFEHYTQSAALQKESGNSRGEAYALNNIGALYSRLGERKIALDYYNQALPLRRLVGDRAGEAQTLYNMMMTWEALDRRRLAIYYGKQAVNKYQEVRGSAQRLDRETQKSLLRAARNYYQVLAGLLIEEGQLDQAVDVLNLYQDQQFFDFNRNDVSPVRQTAFSPRERELAARYDTVSERAERLSSQVEELKRQLGNRQPDDAGTSRLQKLEAELKAASSAFLTFFKDIEKEFSAQRDDKDKVPALQNVADMQAALRELSAATKQKTVALYTLVGAEKYYVLLIAPDGKVKSFESPVKEADLNKQTLEFYALLQSPAYDPRPAGRGIYEIVFRPVEAELKKVGARTLAWSLDGGLRYIPVAALWDGEKYLVERYQNIVFTRAEPERMTRRVSQRWTGVGFGSSRAHAVDLVGDGRKLDFEALPGVAAELRSIFRTSRDSAGILDGAVLLDGEFTNKTFYETLKKRPPLVHLASHFLFRPGDASRSFLLLGDGSPLTLSDMQKSARVFDGVELLTLSACNTAATLADADGREIDGFAELAQRLGASAVIATLWQVSDASTPWLMRRFYQTKDATPGITKSEALSSAQLALLNGTADTRQFSRLRGNGRANGKVVVMRGAPRQTYDTTRADVLFVSEANAPAFKRDDTKPFAHPYYWSPFVLFGNWR